MAGASGLSPVEAAHILAAVLLFFVTGGLAREGHRAHTIRRQLDAYLQWMLADIGHSGGRYAGGLWMTALRSTRTWPRRWPC